MQRSNTIQQKHWYISLTAAASLMMGLAGCGGTPQSAIPSQIMPNGLVANPRVPDFAILNYAPFSRQNVAAIALREWRLFGSPVADADPHSRPDFSPAYLKPERLPGLWQRVGEYWWIGQNPTQPESGWTGRTNNSGTIFDPRNDTSYAWSAAFISYVMRVAGANDRFTYSPNHSTYINAAASGQNPGLTALDPANHAPRTGDLLCVQRSDRHTLVFSSLPTSYAFPAHCGIVVATRQNAPPFGQELSIIGGNVDDAVSLTHVPTDSAGRISANNGQSYDSRYPWLVILEPRYDE